jgi:hypothetical protein
LLKISYHRAIGSYYSGIVQQEQAKYGLSIAYMQAAKSKLDECIKSKPEQEYLSSLKHLLSNVETK